MTFPPKVWDGVLHRLRAEVPAFALDSWIAKLVPELRGDELRLYAPNTFHRNRVRETFLPRIRAIARSLECERVERVVVEVGGTTEQRMACEAHARAICGPEQTQPPADSESHRGLGAAPRHIESRCETTRNSNATARRDEPARRRQLELRAPRDARRRQRDEPAFEESFDNFVVGPANALAREAALALATRRHSSFRTLYLFAEKGMGKTHLARAIAMEAAQRERVRYVTAERFTNAFMAAVRTKVMPAFKKAYRASCDLLVIEDVQFLGGKPGTQLELFHTIAELVECGARVVVTGDRPPQELGAAGLDAQLCDQLGAAFVAPIDTPDLALRRDILRAKAAAGGIGIDDSCIQLLVESLRGSVRDLDASLSQLVTTASLLHRPIDVGLVRQTLATKGALPHGLAPRPTPELVIGVVAEFFQTTPEALASRSRRRDVLVPRQLAMFLCRRFTDASLAEVGRALGREHPAVRNAIKAVEKRVTERAPARYQLESVSERVRQRLEGTDQPATVEPVRTARVVRLRNEDKQQRRG